MAVFVEKPTFITLKIQVRPDRKIEFANWQADLNVKIAAFSGFVSLEFLTPGEIPNEWLIVQRFSQPESAARWRRSEEFNFLKSELDPLVINPEIEEVSTDEFQHHAGVTEVFVTEVCAKQEKAYKEWCAKIHQAEAKFPGFRGVYIQSPRPGKGTHWITLLQFDSMANLDKWLDSPERQQILQEAASFISSLENHRVISPYAGWFASIAKNGQLPPAWKQTLLVLLVLYPVVMLELKYLSPLTAMFDVALATFIGNALSVVLISFPLMPIALSCLDWWTTAEGKKSAFLKNVMGTALVITLYVIEVVIFWHIL